MFFRVVTNLWKLLVSSDAVFELILHFFPCNWYLGRSDAATDPVEV